MGECECEGSLILFLAAAACGTNIGTYLPLSPHSLVTLTTQKQTTIWIILKNCTSLHNEKLFWRSSRLEVVSITLLATRRSFNSPMTQIETGLLRTLKRCNNCTPQLINHQNFPSIIYKCQKVVDCGDSYSSDSTKCVFVVVVEVKKRTFGLILHFAALLFSRQNCVGTRESCFCCISKQCISFKYRDLKMCRHQKFLVTEI